jgi:NhaA family Na+:H+ antiporter
MQSGVHATIAGVLTAISIPLNGGQESSPLHRLEDRLDRLVPYLILPLFSFANAGVSGQHFHPGLLTESLTLGVGLGLLAGKLIGVLGACGIVIRLGVARLPEGANWRQFTGVACLCGIGFTMSLFLSQLAFAEDATLQEEAKGGILLGSLASGLIGTVLLWRKTSPAVS